MARVSNHCLPRRAHGTTRRRSGVAMLLVIIALAVAAILSLTFLRSSGPTMAIASNNDSKAKARAIAESGLAMAVKHVQSSTDWRTDQPHGLWIADVPYGGGTFSVYGTDDDGDLSDDPSDVLLLEVVGRFAGVTHRSSVRVTVASAPFAMEAGTLVADGTAQVVTLQGSYSRPVVVCTPQVIDNTEPLVVRVDEVTGGSFRVWLQRCDGGPVLADPVHYMVMEEGVYNVDGLYCEARRLESTKTDDLRNWQGTQRNYGNRYRNPAVFGQVMTARDADWSVFWSRGGNSGSAPSASTLFVGKHVGEDADTTRADETLGYMVFESGRHSINGVEVDVRLSSDAVTGVTNGAGYNAAFHQSFANPPQVVVLSQAGMDGNNGSWAMLWGATPITTNRARVIVDEDTLRDSERSHTTEQVAVIAFERPPDAFGEQTILQYEFDQAEFTPHLAGHWRLDEPAGGGGGVACYDRVYLNSYAQVDSYDSSRGAYGPTNNAESATLSTNSTAANRVYLNSHSRVEGDAYVGVGGNPTSGVYVNSFSYLTGQRAAASTPALLPGMSPPSGIPAVNGDLRLTGSATLLIDQDLHFRDFYLYDNTAVTVQGHQRIQIDRNFQMHNNSRIVVPPGSSLTVWTGRNVEVYHDAQLNHDSTATDRLTMYLYGSNRHFRMSSNARAAGTIFTRGDFRLNNNAIFSGRALAGDDIELSSNSRFHADIAMDTLGVATNPAVDEIAGNDGGYRGDAVGGAAQPAGLTASGTAATFDGTGDYVQVPHSDAYLLNEGAISFWFNADNAGLTQGLFAKDANGFGEGGHLAIDLAAGRVRARLQSTSATYEVTSGTISSNTWHHVTLSFGAEGMALYLDGVEADTADYGGGLGLTAKGSGNREPIIFGAQASGATAGSAAPLSRYFAGRIDDVRLYNQWCSAAQAAEVMAGHEPSTRTSETLVMDTGNYGQPLHLRINNPANVTWGGGVLRFDAPAVAQSLVNAEKVRTAITQAGGFSLVLRFQRADPFSTSNPSIIMGVTGSIPSTNILVGQAGESYEARARTNQTGSSGILLPAFISSHSLRSDDFVHLTLTYDGSTLRSYLDGQLDHSQPLSGDLDAWSAALPVVIGGAAGGGSHWLGAIDSARLYDQALAPSQAQNLADGLPLNAVGAAGSSVIWVEPQ